MNQTRWKTKMSGKNARSGKSQPPTQQVMLVTAKLSHLEGRSRRHMRILSTPEGEEKERLTEFASNLMTARIVCKSPECRCILHRRRKWSCGSGCSAQWNTKATESIPKSWWRSSDASVKCSSCSERRRSATAHWSPRAGKNLQDFH